MNANSSVCFLQTLGLKDTHSVSLFVIHHLILLMSILGAEKNISDRFQKASELVTVVSWSLSLTRFCLNVFLFFSPVNQCYVFVVLLYFPQRRWKAV